MSPYHVFLLTFLLALSFPPLFSSVSPPVTSPSPSPVPTAGHTPSPSPSPSPIFHSPPAPSPAPQSSSTPVPAPSNETDSSAPTPILVTDDFNQKHVDEANSNAEHSRRLKGAQKAGISVGVIALVVVVGAGVLIYKKRQQNIRRARFGYGTRGDKL